MAWVGHLERVDQLPGCSARKATHLGYLEARNAVSPRGTPLWWYLKGKSRGTPFFGDPPRTSTDTWENEWFLKRRLGEETGESAARIPAVGAPSYENPGMCVQTAFWR